MEKKADEDKVTVDAYHGTAEAYKDSILRTKKFKASNEANDWAGSGIYFFVDEAEEKLVEKCILWSKVIRKYKTSAIIKVLIEIDKDKLLDLTKREQQDVFHKYRAYLFDKVNVVARNTGRELKESYASKRTMDCLTINQICKEFNFEAVKREAYINFHKKEVKENELYPNSDIPNVTMISLRNQEYIKEWGECDVK